MGRTVSKNIAGDVTNYTYDFIGNVLTEANKITNTVFLTASRTYDHNQQVLSEQIVDPDGETINTSYTYDMLGRKDKKINGFKSFPLLRRVLRY